MYKCPCTTCYKYINILVLFIKKTILSVLNCLWIFVKNKQTAFVQIYLLIVYSVLLFYIFTLLPWLVLKSQGESSNFVPVFQIIWLFQFLCLSVKILNFCKLDWDCVKHTYQFGENYYFKLLDLLSHRLYIFAFTQVFDFFNQSFVLFSLQILNILRYIYT